MEASIFDDNVDIFADLTMSSGPKEKPKKKVDTKSIFDDDMGRPFPTKKRNLTLPKTLKSIIVNVIIVCFPLHR